MEKGKTYSPRFQFQVALEAMKGDRKEVAIARVYNYTLPPSPNVRALVSQEHLAESRREHNK